MRNVTKLLAISVLSLMVSGTALAQDYGARVRLQGKSTEPGFGLSGVLEVPTVSSPSNVLAGVGLAHNSDKLEAALHVGVLTLPAAKATSVVDARGTLTLTDNVYAWANLRLQGLEDLNKTSAYGFVMAEYLLTSFVPKVGLGVETENRVLMARTPGTSDYSVGPNMVFHVSPNARLEAAVQFHSEVANQVWARLHVSL